MARCDLRQTLVQHTTCRRQYPFRHTRRTVHHIERHWTSGVRVRLRLRGVGRARSPRTLSPGWLSAQAGRKGEMRCIFAVYLGI